EHLAGMSAALIAIERGRSGGDEDPRPHIDQLLRSAHSIKGGAGFTARRKIEQLAHAMETAVENFRDGRIAANPPPPEAIDALLGALDRVGSMIDDLDHSDAADITDPLARLQP